MKDVEVRTEYRTLVDRDSIFIDCTDTVFVIQKGDTVKVVEKVTEREYRYKMLHDTLRVADTVTVEKVTTLSGTSEGKPVKRWRWFLFGFFSGIIIIFAVRILIKVFLKK